MALTFKLQRDSTELNLQGGATGLQLLDDGYLPKIPPEVPGRVAPPIVEEVRLTSAAASHDALAVYVQSLANFQRWAARYRADPYEAFPVWLYAQLLNETGQRRALVRAIEWSYVSSWFAGAFSADNRQNLAVSIERGPYWEATSAVALATETPAARVASLYDPTSSADILGDAAGRLTLSALTYTATTLDRLWLGIRSDEKHGQAENLQFVWECEVGTVPAGMALTTQSDASNINALANNCVQILPATASFADWTMVNAIRLDSVVNIVTYPDLRQQFGLFTWFLRCKISSAVPTYDVQLRFGYDGMADADYIQGDIINVTSDGTNWNVFKMAVQGLPLRDPHVATASSSAATPDLYTNVQIWVRNHVFGYAFYMDCLILMPVDEGYLFVDAAMDTDQNESLQFSESPDAHLGVYTLTTGNRVKAVPEFDAALFRLPPGDGRIVALIARTSTQFTTDRVTFSGSYTPAYHSLKGAA